MVSFIMYQFVYVRHYEAYICCIKECTIPSCLLNLYVPGLVNIPFLLAHDIIAPFPDQQGFPRWRFPHRKIVWTSAGEYCFSEMNIAFISCHLINNQPISFKYHRSRVIK